MTSLIHNLLRLSSCGLLTLALLGSTGCQTIPHDELYDRQQRLSITGFAELPFLGRDQHQRDIFLGGFSGLFFLGINADTGREEFVTITDRGPNSGKVDFDGDGQLERIFPVPTFAPEIIHLELDRKKNQVIVTKRIPIRSEDRYATGIGAPENIDDPNKCFEGAITIHSQRIPPDALGLDTEEVVRDRQGNYWITDEYHTALLKVNATGTILKRFIPAGNKPTFAFDKPVLPKIFSRHRANRGFEGMAINGEQLFLVVQSPLEPKGPDYRKKRRQKRFSRILVFNTKNEVPTGQYLYPMAAGHWKKTKIGAAVFAGKDQQIFVLEADGENGPTSFKRIFRIDLAPADNLMTLPAYAQDPLYQFENRSWLPGDAKPAKKTLVSDLTAFGYFAPKKVEGLAIASDRLFIVNDNDFGLEGETPPLPRGASSLKLIQDPHFHTLNFLAQIKFPMSEDMSEKRNER